MLNLIISQFRLLKNLFTSMDDSEAPLAVKEKFALFWLLIAGLVMGIFFLLFIYIFATTYEFREFSLEFGPGG